MTALRIERLTVTYGGQAPAVSDLDLAVEPGECVALVGESGSGKSTVVAATLGVLPRSAEVSGRIIVRDHDMVAPGERARRARRGRGVAHVPQDTGAALNPVVPVVDQVGEVLRVHDRLSRRAARVEAAKLLEVLDVDPVVSARRLLPDELSGGMRQRALIAIALALAPEVVVADEPTSSLDPEMTLGVLEAFAQLRSLSGTAVLFVTHDLGVARAVAHRTAVLNHGRIVEEGLTAQVLSAPSSPHTRALVDAVPRLDRGPSPRHEPGAD